VEFPASTKNSNTHCAGCVNVNVAMHARDQSSIFSIGGKFRPDYGLLLELHALTLVACSYALLLMTAIRLIMSMFPSDWTLNLHLVIHTSCKQQLS